MSADLKRLLRNAAEGRSALAPDLLFLAALERIETLEKALEPFAATARLVAAATPDTKPLRFGFGAAFFRRAHRAFVGEQPAAAGSRG